MQQAFLLHSYPYKDTSAMLKFFSLEEGIITAIAKGIKRQGSSWRAFLHPFTPLLISLSGKGDIKVLSQLEVTSLRLPFEGLQLVSALYINEIILNILPQGAAYPEIYHLYGEALLALAGVKDPEPVLRSFEMALLEQLGYLPDFKKDQLGCEISQEHYYWVRPEQMPERVGEEYAHSPEVFIGKQLLGIADHLWQDAAILKAAKRLLRPWMNRYCKGQRLKSRDLLIKYKT